MKWLFSLSSTCINIHTPPNRLLDNNLKVKLKTKVTNYFMDLFRIYWKEINIIVAWRIQESYTEFSNSQSD